MDEFITAGPPVPVTAQRHIFTPESKKALLREIVQLEPYKDPLMWDAVTNRYGWWCYKNIVPARKCVPKDRLRKKVKVMIAKDDPSNDEETQELIKKVIQQYTESIEDAAGKRLRRDKSPSGPHSADVSRSLESHAAEFFASANGPAEKKRKIDFEDKFSDAVVNATNSAIMTLHTPEFLNSQSGLKEFGSAFGTAFARSFSDTFELLVTNAVQSIVGKVNGSSAHDVIDTTQVVDEDNAMVDTRLIKNDAVPSSLSSSEVVNKTGESHEPTEHDASTVTINGTEEHEATSVTAEN